MFLGILLLMKNFVLVFYNEITEVMPIIFIRPNEKFNSINDLKIQIEKDKIVVERYFERLG